MTEQTEAERFLLERVRAGDAGSWHQLVRRYQGRLLAFARGRDVGSVDAEDLVQDTFLLFLRSLPDFRARASVETYLFVILRRRVSDHFRGRGRKEKSADPAAPPPEAFASPDLSGSAYVRRDEQREAARAALSEAVGALASRMKEELNFRDLRIAEALFHAHLRNKEVAALCDVEESFVGLLKHRWLKQLRERVSASPAGAGRGERAAPADPTDAAALDSLLTEVWEELRPGCPKRSTLGAYLLGTLDPPWVEYVQSHVSRLGCPLCQANLKDLQDQTAAAVSPLHRRIVESTIGFFRRPPAGG